MNYSSAFQTVKYAHFLSVTVKSSDQKITAQYPSPKESHTLIPNSGCNRIGDSTIISCVRTRNVVLFRKHCMASCK